MDIAKQAYDNNPSLPVLLMSGFTRQSFETENGLPEGVEVLFKPFTKLKLSEAISKAKSKRPEKSSPPSADTVSDQII
ncbi:MAG: hypothetical protein JKY04_03910 [Sneathiella sp.]|nr:hypothetical protein [Sneathiella sp.]